MSSFVEGTKPNTPSLLNVVTIKSQTKIVVTGFFRSIAHQATVKQPSGLQRYRLQLCCCRWLNVVADTYDMPRTRQYPCRNQGAPISADNLRKHQTVKDSPFIATNWNMGACERKAREEWFERSQTFVCGTIRAGWLSGYVTPEPNLWISGTP